MTDRQYIIYMGGVITFVIMLMGMKLLWYVKTYGI